MSGAVETIRRAIWKFVSEQNEAAQSQSFFAFLSNRDDLFAEAVAAALTAPPARTYAEGAEDAAKLLDERVKFIDNLMTDDMGLTDIRIGCQLEAERGARTIRLLSQGDKA